MRARSGGRVTDGRQVCLVGGGVEGLTAAAVLRRRGHHPTVVVSPTRATDGRHELVLWSGAVALLDDLGLEAVGDALAGGTGVQAWRFRGTAGDRRRTLQAPVRGARPALLVVDRAGFREALRDDLPSGCLRVSKTPTAVEPTSEGPVVAFDDGVRERFDAVVGADGRRSWVRRTAFGGDPRRSHGTATWAFRAPAGAGARTTPVETWGPDWGLLLGPGALGRVVAAGDAVTSFPRAIRRSTGALPERVDPDAVGDAVRLADGVGWARRWARDGVALLGDAAHAFHPFLALGGSLAVADADALAAALGTDAPPAALRRYERRRRARIAALAHRVAARDRVRIASAPFPAAGTSALRDVRLSLLEAAFGPGPCPLASTVRGRP